MLTRRTADTLVRNRLTLAILLGSPALVVAMFAVLFRPGAFVFAHPNPSAVIMIVFWIAFGGFFFGLTYGLLQICTEMPIVRRERLVGLRLGPYLMSKVAVLLPFLLLVDLLMIGVLRVLDRLPALDGPTFASLAVTLLLDAVAALALGLFTSAAVTNPAQATLALPLLCFPAVLFSGAILPLAAMAPVGRVISARHARSMGLRSDRTRPRSAPTIRHRRIQTRTAPARPVRQRRHTLDRVLLARAHRIHRRSSSPAHDSRSHDAAEPPRASNPTKKRQS